LSLPVVLLPYVMMTMGLAWFLASLGVFLRDIQQVVPLAVTGLMFLSPLFYPVSAVPDVLRSTIYLNPLTFVLETSRNAIFLNQWPDWRGVVVYYLVAVAVMWLGWTWFEKTRKGFADVL
jgi:lipopolysaccharide transport system permease protein